MSKNSGNFKNKVAVHVIIFLAGGWILQYADRIDSNFWQALFINVGSTLIGTTILFIVFHYFESQDHRREVETDKVQALTEEINKLNLRLSQLEAIKEREISRLAQSIRGERTEDEMESQINKLPVSNHRDGSQ